MHVLIEAFHDVGKDVHMHHLGLLSIPFGERIDGCQVLGIVDAAGVSGRKRKLDRIPAGKLLLHEVAGAADLILFADIGDHVVVEFDA